MSRKLNVGSGGSGFDPYPLPKAKKYKATCVSVIHVGNIEKSFNNKSKIVDTVFITWELHGTSHTWDEDKGPQPYHLTKEYTLSINDKANLGKMIEAWREKDFTEHEKAGNFNIGIMLGKPAIIKIKIVEKKSYNGPEPDEPNSKSHYMDLRTIEKPETDDLEDWPELENEKLFWTYEKDFNEKLFMRIPKFIRAKMYESEEWEEYGYPSPDELEESKDEEKPKQKKGKPKVKQKEEDHEEDDDDDENVDEKEKAFGKEPEMDPDW